MSFSNLTIQTVHQGLIKKDFSCLELTDYYLNQIKKVDGKIKAYLTITNKEAKEQAKEIDQKIKKGEKLGPLAGVPMAIKDVIMTKGVRTTAGSKILENYIATYDATAIERLKKEGIVILGKTNCDEFAMGASTENSGFFPTKNPYDLTRVPGGSSGGSAAALASDQCLAALGTDTGGSVRQPASFCGLVGLKPTYGRISRSGLIAMASSLDQIGIFSKTVADSALILNYLAGRDEFDATTVSRPKEDFTRDLKKDIQDLKIGLPEEYFSEGLDKKVLAVINQAIDILKDQGINIKKISLPYTKYALPCYYIIMPCEVSANLARFDGVRYGSRKNGKDLFETYLKTRSDGFGAEVRRRIMIGTYALSKGYYDAYYHQALKVRAVIIKDFQQAFKKVDLILTPTTPEVAFKIGAKMADPVKMYLSDIYTSSANIAGLPGLSLPVGMVKEKDKELPVGLQIMADHFHESKIFQLANFLEKAINFKNYGLQK